MKKLILIVLAGLALAAGCRSQSQPEMLPLSREIILATTTSTQDSGLLDVLIPIFEQQSGYLVKPVAVGSGQALKMGESGNADVLLVHAPEDERLLMEAGFGSVRLLVMFNDFVLLGAAADPAQIRGVEIDQALQAIAGSGTSFVSRGDDSGTHKMEKKLWQRAGVMPQGSWYIETGQGMGATLRVASEKGGYTISDRASYLSLQGGLDLEVLIEGEAALLNIYHVITINPAVWPKVNVQGAQAFAQFLVSPEGQDLIAEFGVEQYGQPLFTPAAGQTETDLGVE